MVAMAQFLFLLWLALSAMLVGSSLFGRRRPRRAVSRLPRAVAVPPRR